MAENETYTIKLTADEKKNLTSIIDVAFTARKNLFETDEWGRIYNKIANAQSDWRA